MGTKLFPLPLPLPLKMCKGGHATQIEYNSNKSLGFFISVLTLNLSDRKMRILRGSTPSLGGIGIKQHRLTPIQHSLLPIRCC